MEEITELTETSSWQTLYRVIGLLGMFLPIIIIFILGYFPPSISQSYYTNARDIFVITMGSLGLFFLSNTGVTKTETWCNKISGICALIVPLVGCESKLAWLHFTSAVIFFLTLSFVCLFVFTKIRSICGYTKQKIIRNRIYKTCGITILLGIGFIAITGLIGYGEVLMLWSYGFAYFIAGNTLFKDK